MRKAVAVALMAAMAAGGGGAAAVGADAEAETATQVDATSIWNHYYAHAPSAVAALSAIHAGFPSLDASVSLPPDASNLDTMTAAVSPNEDDLGFSAITQQQHELHMKQLEVRAQREHIRVATQQLAEFTSKLESAKAVLKENETNLHKWIDDLGVKLKEYQDRLRKTTGGESEAAEESDETKASFRALHEGRMAKLKVGIDQLKHERRVHGAREQKKAHNSHHKGSKATHPHYRGRTRK